MRTVRAVKVDDALVWAQMRNALWPDDSLADHGEEIELFFSGDFPRDPWEVLIAEDEDGRAVGFAELSIRPYAEGCDSHGVAYLEGWFVVPDVRDEGVGRALLLAAENWGRSHGCNEFASDVHPNNHVSAAAHLALGFSDAGLVRCFRKDI